MPVIKPCSQQHFTVLSHRDIYISLRSNRSYSNHAIRECLVNTAGYQAADAIVSDDNGSRKLTYQLGKAAHGAIKAEATL